MIQARLALLEAHLELLAPLSQRLGYELFAGPETRGLLDSAIFLFSNTCIRNNGIFDY